MAAAPQRILIYLLRGLQHLVGEQDANVETKAQYAL